MSFILITEENPKVYTPRSFVFTVQEKSSIKFLYDCNFHLYIQQLLCIFNPQEAIQYADGLVR